MHYLKILKDRPLAVLVTIAKNSFFFPINKIILVL